MSIEAVVSSVSVSVPEQGESRDKDEVEIFESKTEAYA